MAVLFYLSVFCCLGYTTQASIEKRQGQGNDPSKVAFSVGLTHDLHLLHAETVVFDRVFTNIASAYNTTTGQFVCPTSGIYVFQFHTLSHRDKTAWLEMYRNTMYVCSIYGHTGTDYSSAGNSALLKLKKGDKVYIKAVDQSFGVSTTIYGQSDEVYTMFSGYMIAPVYEEISAIG